MTVSYTVEGLERYPINLRYPQDFRDSLDSLRALPVVTPTGANIVLSDAARVDVADGPAMIRSENARPSGWVFVDLQGRDLGGFVDEAKRRVAAELELPPGYSLGWSDSTSTSSGRRSGSRSWCRWRSRSSCCCSTQFPPHQRRAADPRGAAVRARGRRLAALPVDYDLSIAAAVGFIALAGVAAETGVVMIMYLEHAWSARRQRAAEEGREPTHQELRDAIVEGALLRLRPKLMTVNHRHRRPAADHVGIRHRVGGDAAQSRAPMVGGNGDCDGPDARDPASMYLIVNGWNLRRA